jgi:hypothetical protein
MFGAMITPIFRGTRLCVTVCGIMHPRSCRPVAWKRSSSASRLPAETSWVHYTTSCNTQYSAPEDGQNNCPKYVEQTGIIYEPLLLHIVGCLYYLYQWCTVKQISDNEIYLLIKYTKSILWGVAKHLSYVQDARCLKVNLIATPHNNIRFNVHFRRDASILAG